MTDEFLFLPAGRRYPMTLAELDQALRNHLAAEMAQIDENVAAIVEEQRKDENYVELEDTRRVEVFNTKLKGTHGEWSSLGEMSAEASIQKFK